MNNYYINFGTDGWRGLIDEEVNFDSIQLVAQAFADYLKLKTKATLIKVAIGYDGRKYSREFAILFSKILSGNNIYVFLSEKIEPTPIVSFYVKNNFLNAGVMITASHNPFEYNGVKFKNSYGGPFLSEETLQVENLIGMNRLLKNDDNISQVDFRNDYLNHLNNIIDFESIRNTDLNILIDSMSGAGQSILENILSKNNCKVKTIYKIAEHDFCGRYAEPIEKNLKPLNEELSKSDYSIAVATDGDADRIGFMLENGEWLNTQEAILIIADYLCNEKKMKGNLVKTASVTDKVKLFQSAERKIIDVQVGFKYICEKMLSENIVFGCEESGGFGFGNHIPERDGIFSALIMIEALAKSGLNKISNYVNNKRKLWGNIFYNRIDLPYSKANRLEKIPKLFLYHPESISNFKAINIQEWTTAKGVINGLKIYLEGNARWILIRASETEPLFRIYAEGESDNEVETILESGIKLLV